MCESKSVVRYVYETRCANSTIRSSTDEQNELVRIRQRPYSRDERKNKQIVIYNPSVDGLKWLFFLYPRRGVFFMKKILTFGPLFIIIAALLWSFDGVLRISLYSLPPSVVVFYEHLLGAAVLLLFVPKWFGDLKKMTRKEWIAITLVSLFSGALGTIFYTTALQKTHFIQYSVVVLLQQQLQPIWVFITAALLLKEKISKRFLFWALLSLVAAYFISFKNLTVNFSTDKETIAGAVLGLLAGLVWGTSTAFSKLVLNKVSYLTGTVLRFYLAPIFAFLFIASQNQVHALFTLTQMQWITLWIITFSAGMVAVVIYYYGLKKTPARVSTICELVFPASAILIDYFYYHHGLSVTQILGVILLLFCIYQITRKGKYI